MKLVMVSVMLFPFRWLPAQLQRAALGSAAALEQLGHVHSDRDEPALAELGGQASRLDRQDDVPAVADRVQAEYLGVFVLGLDQLGELFRDGRPPGVIERGRIVHGGIAVEYAQRGVQM